MSFVRFSLAAAAAALSAGTMAHAAPPDPGKKACAVEARSLCPSEMRSMSRKKVEACMIVRIEQTSPACHSAMLQMKAQHDALVKR